eukprot:CAMPEP_0168851166 /NCGR_PEP_ID=MMETSP0727-20121128/12268_1 /TAXON_ID=265536 /ORGANISM="Amphiprora sp., Strain CCMP467" /LENGTH=576 /DNA_ID=CAMNT_0008905143 /DNA_START=181 /DNA_END=1912 /DNA_ORIENTATION=+
MGLQRSTELSEEQLIPIAILPKISAMLSFLGSAWIMAEVLTGRDVETRLPKLKHPYHRLLLGMSFLDTIESVANIFSTWALPADTPNAWQAKGNTMTCNLQGFFLQASVGVPTYNAALSIKAFGTATAAVSLKLINPAGPWCWIAPFPSDCKDSWRYPDEANCQRGDNAWIYRWAFFYAMMWFCLLFTSVCTIMVARKVYTVDQTSLKYRRPEISGPLAVENSTAPGTNEQDTNNEPGTENGRDNKRASFIKSVSGSLTRATSRLGSIRDSHKRFAENNARTMEIFKQAVWYVLAFYLTYCWSFVSRLLAQILGHTFYGLMILHSFFDPLQGFLNFFIYQRPRYLRERKDHPHLSRWQCFGNILRLTKYGPPPSRKSSSQTQTSLPSSSFSKNFKASGGSSAMMAVTPSAVRMSGEGRTSVSELSRDSGRALSGRQSDSDLVAVMEPIVDCDEGKEDPVAAAGVIETDNEDMLQQEAVLQHEERIVNVDDKYPVESQEALPPTTTDLIFESEEGDDNMCTPTTTTIKSLSAIESGGDGVNDSGTVNNDDKSPPAVERPEALPTTTTTTTTDLIHEG